MKSLIFLLLLVAVTCVQESQSFAPTPTQRAVMTPLVAQRVAITAIRPRTASTFTSTFKSTFTSTQIFASSKDEEIAALEEKLRQLRDTDADATTAEFSESEAESSPPPSTTPLPPPPTSTSLESQSQSQPQSQPQSFPVTRALPVKNQATVDDFDELLSESWKDNDVSASEGGGAVLKNLAIAGIALLVAVAVSQVPVGQDGYDRYTTAKPNTSIDLG
jgi:hypothetical protein